MIPSKFMGGGGGASTFSQLSGNPWANAALAAQLGIMHFDAGSLIPRATNGPGVAVLETATNRRMRDVLDFDAATDQFAQVWFVWPEGWNTFTVEFFWRCATGTGSVVWGAQALVVTDGDAEDVAFGTAQTVTDAAASANTHRQSAATPAITPAGTVGAGKRTSLQIFRDADNGSDDMSQVARLTGILIRRAS